MCEELKTIDMELPPVFCGNVYINVPGGDDTFFCDKLIKIVEDIGRVYGTVRGSALKKGIHYIFSKTLCTSKRQIKMMMRNVPVAYIHQSDDVAFIFRCSRKHYIEVLATIIKFSPFEKDLKPKELVNNTIAGLRFVSSRGTGAIKTEASDMIDKMDNIGVWG